MFVLGRRPVRVTRSLRSPATRFSDSPVWVAWAIGVTDAELPLAEDATNLVGRVAVDVRIGPERPRVEATVARTDRRRHQPGPLLVRLVLCRENAATGDVGFTQSPMITTPASAA